MRIIRRQDSQHLCKFPTQYLLDQQGDFQKAQSLTQIIADDSNTQINLKNLLYKKHPGQSHVPDAQVLLQF
jgi:hypothetical protein